MFDEMQIKAQVVEEIKRLKMESPVNCNERYDLGYQASPSSVDQTDISPTQTPAFSTISADSFRYSRTYSETSEFSELTDDTSCPSPVCWPALKSPNQAVLSRLGMKQHKNSVIGDVDDQEPADFGRLTYNLFYILFLLKLYFFICVC